MNHKVYSLPEIDSILTKMLLDHEEREKQMRLDNEAKEKQMRLDNEAKEKQMRLDNEAKEKQWKEITNRQDKEWIELKKMYGGISKTQGDITEDYFFEALSENMIVSGLKFDYIDRNLHRKRKQIEAEYDIILYNKNKLMIVEVKHNYKLEYFENLEYSVSKFKKLSPEYFNHQLYVGIAAMTFDKRVIVEAEKKGIFIIKPQGNGFKIGNKKGFAPTQF